MKLFLREQRLREVLPEYLLETLFVQLMLSQLPTGVSVTVGTHQLTLGNNMP